VHINQIRFQCETQRKEGKRGIWILTS